MCEQAQAGAALLSLGKTQQHKDQGEKLLSRRRACDSDAVHRIGPLVHQPHMQINSSAGASDM